MSNSWQCKIHGLIPRILRTRCLLIEAVTPLHHLPVFILKAQDLPIILAVRIVKWTANLLNHRVIVFHLLKILAAVVSVCKLIWLLPLFATLVISFAIGHVFLVAIVLLGTAFIRLISFGLTLLRSFVS